MSNLKVAFCMVCEDIRPELHGKFTILGFFGLLPNVLIKVQELNEPMGRLLFLINISGDPGKYTFKLELVDPDRKVIKSTNLSEMELTGDLQQRAMTAVNVIGLLIKTEGNYKLRISHKKKVFYESSLSFALGEPGLFTA